MKPLQGRRSTIQKMTVRHLEDVLKIEGQLFHDPWSRKSFQFEILANNYSLPLVLLLDDKIIGYTIIWIIFEEFHIANFAIHPDYQRQGLGTYLLDEVLKKAVGLEYALLEVREKNLTAIHLYEKFRFKKIAIREHYYSNGDNAIIMRKWFNPQQATPHTDPLSKQKTKI